MYTKLVCGNLPSAESCALFGPVYDEGVEPDCLVQSKSSSNSVCCQPHKSSSSKLQIGNALGNLSVETKKAISLI